MLRVCAVYAKFVDTTCAMCARSTINSDVDNTTHYIHSRARQTLCDISMGHQEEAARFLHPWLVLATRRQAVDLHLLANHDGDDGVKEYVPLTGWHGFDEGQETPPDLVVVGHEVSD